MGHILVVWTACWCWLSVRCGANGPPASFLCTQVTRDTDHGAAQLRVSDHAKGVILRMREELVQQKESLLDQRETIHELTAKLALCEGSAHLEHGHDLDSDPGMERVHHRSGYRKDHRQGFGKFRDTMGDPPTASDSQVDKLDVKGSEPERAGALRRLFQPQQKSLEGGRTRASNRTGGTPRRGLLKLDAVLSEISPRQPTGFTAGEDPAVGLDNFQVSFPLRTNYMFARMTQTLSQEIFAFTICLRLKTSAAPGVGTPFSYAVPGQSNELVLAEWGTSPMELLINDKVATLPLAVSDGTWHHVCVTWSTRDGVWEVYQDGLSRGCGQNLAPWHPIRLGGVFILGQEQDAVGGRFDATQAFVGNLSDFNMWDRVLQPDEVRRLAACDGRAAGNLVAWTVGGVELRGGAVRLPSHPCQGS
ncbi:neuronal pentraxin-2-like [Pristis pectinata]|uniref:neuronal pentraxin-2-like n=1 Tax=Pristis pectinata TaxID=685728 RepID=UPI00223DAB0F|nr:neuronal pentraxin-2-like [Pristis pectinata]